MKKILLLFCVLAFSGCDKDDQQADVVEELPAATQTGAVMLACYVNGKPFICKDYEMVTAYYQWTNGGYGFLIRGLNKTDLMWSIELGNIGSAEIQEGQTYILNDDDPGYWGGGDIKIAPDITLGGSLTNSTYTGEMTITRFDVSGQIVSGTFWFDIQNPWTGETIEIREGRFDTFFAF